MRRLIIFFSFIFLSGVLTGSTCSESSSNSGNSDIIDPCSPCSPCSVTSFHLGDDSGLPSTSSSKPTEFSNSELLLTSKMLFENSPRKEENDVACWAWDKNIEWNDRYELTRDDIDVEVKRADFFENCDESDSRCSVPGQGNNLILDSKLDFSLPSLKINLVNRKSLNSIHSSPLNSSDLNISATKDSLARPCCEESPKTVVDSSVSNNAPVAGETNDFLFGKVFQSKRVRVGDDVQLSGFPEKICAASGGRRTNGEKCPPTVPKTTAISKFFVNNSYPLDFFNILPSVFKSPMLHSADCSWELTEADDDSCDGDSSVDTTISSIDENSCCQSEPKNADDVSNVITINNNNNCNSSNNNNINNNYINDDSIKQTNCSHSNQIRLYQHYYRHTHQQHHRSQHHHHSQHQYLKHVDLDDDDDDDGDDDADDTSETGDHCSDKSSLFSIPESAALLEVNKNGVAEIQKHSPDATCESVYKENIRFPTDKKLSFLSERICRWSDCVDHISSSAKLIEHLQVGLIT